MFKEEFLSKYPILGAAFDIKNIYDKFPKDANKIMWSIFLLHYPDSSINPKINIPYEERAIDIKSSYFNIDLSNEFVKLAVVSFINHLEPIELKMYAIQKKKLEELTMYFNTLDIQKPEDRDEYLSISKILNSIWTNFDKVKKDFLSSLTKETSMEIEGKGNLSKSEERRLKG